MITIDPATLQAGIQAIADELAAELRAKGYAQGDARIEVRSGPGEVWIWLGGFPDHVRERARFVFADTLDKAVAATRQKIAALPRLPTQEDIGRTLGVIEAEG